MIFSCTQCTMTKPLHRGERSTRRRIDWRGIGFGVAIALIFVAVSVALTRHPYIAGHNRCEEWYRQARTYEDTLEVDRRVTTGRDGTWNCGFLRRTREQ